MEESLALELLGSSGHPLAKPSSASPLRPSLSSAAFLIESNFSQLPYSPDPNLLRSNQASTSPRLIRLMRPIL